MTKLDIFEVSEDVKKVADLECSKLDCSLTLIVRASDQETDKHLYMVVGKKMNPLWDGREYCVWTLNTSLGGFHNGTYDVLSCEAFRKVSDSLFITETL